MSAAEHTRPPAKPRRMAAVFERSGDRLFFRCRGQNRRSGVFIVLWLVAWTIVCAMATAAVVRDPQVPTSLLTAFLWAAWVFVVCMALRSFFQREELTLDRSGISFVRRVFIRVKTCAVPLRSVRAFTQYAFRVSGDADSSWICGIEMRTAGKPLRFARELPTAKLDWLEHQLNDHLVVLRGSLLRAAKNDAEPATPAALSVASVPLARPSDSHWTRKDGFKDLAFTERGRLGCIVVLWLAFENLFGNGIIAMFVLALAGVGPIKNPPEGAEWWAMFLFLIPFVVLGSLVFYELLRAVLEPARRTTWTFTRDCVERRTEWFGFGSSGASWPVDGLRHIELQSVEGSRLQFVNLSWLVGEVISWQLLLVDRQNTEVCAIDGLTEGEARWIGDVLLRERAAWFR